MPTLHMQFEAGVTGEVEFICEVFRFDTVSGDEIGVPFSQVEPISTNMLIDLISGEDPSVTPEPWEYTVKIRANDVPEFLCFVTMPMTDAEFNDVVRIDGPITPEWFVLKSEFLNLQSAIGDPVSHADVDQAIEDHDGDPAAHPDIRALIATEATTNAAQDLELADHEGRLDGHDTDIAGLTNDIDAEVTNRIADVDAEQARAEAAEDTLTTDLADEVTRAEAAEGVLDGRLDTAEADIDAIDADLDTEIANRIADVDAEEAARIADVNAEESRAIAVEATKAPLASPAFTGNPTAPTPPAADNDTSVATTAFVQGEIASKAPLASPAFTGNPTAPTATAGDNDTTVATTAFVHGEVALEATARDTAIGVETSRATTAEGLLAPKASPAFTGNPTAPTPAGGDNDTSVATTAFVQGELASYAPKASPAFTGNPTAPTATAGDNDTTIATTAFVTTAVAQETSDRTTADALKANIASPVLTGNPQSVTPPAADNDTSIATTAWVQTEIAAKAPLASPALTGNPTAPTPSSGDNDTSIATTAFVQTELGLYVPKSLLTTKGDLIVRDASGPVRKAVGANDTFLVADSSDSAGVKYRVLAYTDMWTLPRCTVSDAAATIPTGTGGTIIGTTATESIDTHGFHSNVTNPGRITIPSGLAGTYLVMPKISWQTSSGTGIRRINIDINAGSITNTLYVLPAAASSAMNFGLTAIVTLSVGDFMQIECVHTQGANLTATMSEWTAIRIGP